jgi:hypothetical protein
MEEKNGLNWFFLAIRLRAHNAGRLLANGALSRKEGAHQVNGVDDSSMSSF